MINNKIKRDLMSRNFLFIEFCKTTLCYANISMYETTKHKKTSQNVFTKSMPQTRVTMIPKKNFLWKSWNPFGFKVFFCSIFVAKISDVHDDANGETRGCGVWGTCGNEKLFPSWEGRLENISESIRQMLNHASRTEEKLVEA